MNAIASVVTLHAHLSDQMISLLQDDTLNASESEALKSELWNCAYIETRPRYIPHGGQRRAHDGIGEQAGDQDQDLEHPVIQAAAKIRETRIIHTYMR
jgi:hypothetical protein